MASLVLEELASSEEGEPRVRGVGLEVGAGEVVALAGPSGAGKTTTLRLVAGLTPGRGRVLVGGRDVGAGTAEERGVVALLREGLEQDAFHVDLLRGASVQAALAAVVPLPGAGGDPGPPGEVASRLGLGGLLTRRPSTLSAGELERLLLAAAFLRRPSVLLLDAPLPDLDARSSARVRGELRALARSSGTATLYATQGQWEAMATGDRLAVLSHGRLAQVGPPGAVYDRPATLEVAAFLGVPPMNLFAGALAPVENGVRFRGRSLTIPVAPLAPTGDQVVLGVRPEHVLLVNVKPDRVGSPDAWATVQRVEPLGLETVVHCRTDQGEEVSLRSGERVEVQADQLVGLRIDRAHLHLFDLESGRRVPQPPLVGEAWWMESG